ncbi:MAG: 50S ribosomal protein L4 [Candidatus Nanoarchaeia archaeon]|nr:50S ribosomal protein L4 [Candidatus Nanoarchaeia archaeon]
MKANYFDSTGKKIKQFDLPSQFSEEFRPDLIKRAVLAVQSNTRQAYGVAPRAGKRQHGKLSRRRRDYKSSYGIGISRVPRKILWHRGTQFGWVGAYAPHTVKGRVAHPPKAGKVWSEKINIKERKKAIRSALSATIDADIVKTRGHLFNELPTVIDSKIESLEKTHKVIELFNNLGLQDEVQRLQYRKIRAGKGKSRGRKYKTKTGPLLVVSGTCALTNAAENIPGVKVCNVRKLNAELLAPGTSAGRLTIYTDKALEIMEKEKLFLTNEKIAKEVKEEKKETKKTEVKPKKETTKKVKK